MISKSQIFYGKLSRDRTFWIAKLAYSCYLVHGSNLPPPPPPPNSPLSHQDLDYKADLEVMQMFSELTLLVTHGNFSLISVKEQQYFHNNVHISSTPPLFENKISHVVSLTMCILTNFRLNLIQPRRNQKVDP